MKKKEKIIDFMKHNKKMSLKNAFWINRIRKRI